jgi:hypothetical protein
MPASGSGDKASTGFRPEHRYWVDWFRVGAAFIVLVG